MTPPSRQDDGNVRRQLVCACLRSACVVALVVTDKGGEIVVSCCLSSEPPDKMTLFCLPGRDMSTGDLGEQSVRQTKNVHCESVARRTPVAPSR